MTTAHIAKKNNMATKIESSTLSNAPANALATTRHTSSAATTAARMA